MVSTPPERDGVARIGQRPDGRGTADAGDRDDGRHSQLAEELFGAIGALRRAARRETKRLGPISPDDPLTGSQLDLLRLLERRPGMFVAEAAQDLGLAANTVSTLVGQLSARRLVARSPDPRDRRVARLVLTDQARARMTRWRRRRAGAVSDVLARLPEDEVEQLVRAIPLLRKLATELEERPR
jgi:DNA-binding MarR family transcriptional regulator